MSYYFGMVTNFFVSINKMHLAHRNYVGEHATVGPVIATLEYFDADKQPPNLNEHKFRVLLRTKNVCDRTPLIDLTSLVKTKKKFLKDDMWLFIMYNSSGMKRQIYRALETSDNLHAQKLAGMRLKQVKDKKFAEELLKMERKMLQTSYKFGVLYCKEDQVAENEMFCNGAPNGE